MTANGQLFEPGEEARIRQELNIPEGAKVTIGKLVKELPPPTTYGWTDEQIARMPLEQLTAMLDAEKAAEDSLRQTLKDQKARRKGFQALVRRKKELG